MTTPKNFPGAKHQRRISAKERLEKLIAGSKDLLINGQGNFDREKLSRDIFLKQKELSILEERIRTGGRKSTKKTGANTGRRM